MEAKRFKSGGSGGGNDREQDRRSRAEIAARAAAANGRVVPSSDSAPTSEQDYVTSQVRAAVQAAARGKAMTAMKGDVDAGDSSMADEPVAETGGATTSQMKDSTMGGPHDEDDWLFLSVHRYHHLSMYKLDALPLCMDVDPGRDRLAMGVSREKQQVPETTDRGGGGGGGGDESQKSQKQQPQQQKDGTPSRPPPSAITYQLLIFRVPDKISAKKTETERDLSSNRDLKYLAGADVGGKQPLRQVRFYDSDTIFALQDYTLTVWNISRASDFLIPAFTIQFGQSEGRLADFRIAHNKLSVYLAFNDQCKIVKYRVRRENRPVPDNSEEPSASTQAPIPLIRLAAEPWDKSTLHFKEGNLADLHDLWFWNTLFDYSSIRPEVFIDGDPVDFEMGRSMLASEWAANNDPRNNPKITWYYTSKRGLFGATARLSDKPEAKMLAFRSQTSTKWDVWSATLGFSQPEPLALADDRPLEINVHPDLEDEDLFRVSIVVGDHVYNYQVTPDDGIVEVFRHDSHSGTVVRTAVYPQNPDVVFSADEQMNVHVWWPDPKKLVFRQLPTIDFFNSSTTGGAVVEYSTLPPAATAIVGNDQPLNLHHTSS